MKLNNAAKEALRAAEVTQAAWIRHHFGDDAKTWGGDACGCPDDRCIGYHHNAPDDCNCLPVLLAHNQATAGPRAVTADNDDLWPIERVAEFHNCSVSRAYSLVSENNVKRVSGYPADQVKAIPRPGKGTRTDLAHAKDCLPEDRCVECGGCDCGGRGAVPRACDGAGCQSVNEAEQWNAEMGWRPGVAPVRAMAPAPHRDRTTGGGPMTNPDDLVIYDIVPTHPEGFGGHIFEYESDSDLFCCVNEGCGKYEIVVRDSDTGVIEPCQGKTEEAR